VWKIALTVAPCRLCGTDDDWMVQLNVEDELQGLTRTQHCDLSSLPSLVQELLTEAVGSAIPPWAGANG
jgi:hypothetical protein